MEYTTLGKTDLHVSRICLGTMTFGEQNTEAEGHEQLDYALDHGINFIDTAEMYSVPGRKETQGSTERIIGSWIQKKKNRDKFILATKITGPSPSFTFLRDPLNFSKQQINEAINGSLDRLKTDYVDLYQLHWPERNVNNFSQRGYKHKTDEGWEDNLLEVLQSMEELIDSGKVRHFGVSNETPWGLMRFLQLAEQHGLSRCISIQNPFNLLNRTFEIGLAEIAMREQVSLLAYSPMGFGLLSGKYHRGEATSFSRINQFKQMARYSRPQAYEASRLYLEIAEANELNPAQMALAFVNQQPFTGSNIIGATNLEQLRENMESIQLKLSPEVLKAIEEVHETIPNPAP
ncbi:MAG: NADP(H)-dependent aldo-keto reductase [Saprospiraceae bacterium]|nr:NADP(H)-dependent aldo-keto reductase [Saprospiraceae bacterium]MCB9324581.1 NADP(H)-dependent aldo-keto reductase [Lewinellaceae bacterium]